MANSLADARARTVVVVGALRTLGLYAVANDVQARRRTAAEGVQHIEDTVARGRRTESWNRWARHVAEELRQMMAWYEPEAAGDQTEPDRAESINQGTSRSLRTGLTGEER